MMGELLFISANVSNLRDSNAPSWNAEARRSHPSGLSAIACYCRSRQYLSPKTARFGIHCLIIKQLRDRLVMSGNAKIRKWTAEQPQGSSSTYEMARHWKAQSAGRCAWCLATSYSDELPWDCSAVQHALSWPLLAIRYEKGGSMLC